MAASTLASTNPNLSSTFFAFEDNPPPRPREASFSSYLSAADDEIFSLTLSGEFITDTKPTSVQISLGSGRKEKPAQDDELDVFGAERYFSQVMDSGEVVINAEKPPRSSPDKEIKSASRRKPPSGTPSTRSEASGQSWTAVLMDKQKGTPEAIQQKVPRSSGVKRFLGVFRCSCAGQSSIAVGKVTKGDDGRSPASCKQVRPELWCAEETVWRRADKAGAAYGPRTEDCFALRPTLGISRKVFGEEETARMSSLVAYGAPFMGKEFGSGLRRSLGMMAPFPSSGASATAEDDACSESSSDLFEIDSVSTSTLQLGNGSVASAATTCSAPSEASIEWSVVTASAANFPAASDGEWTPPEAWEATGGHHRRPGVRLLLGCGTGNTYKLPEMVDGAGWPLSHRFPAVEPAIRYQPESSRSVGFEQARTRHVPVTRQIPNSISTQRP